MVRAFATATSLCGSEKKTHHDRLKGGSRWVMPGWHPESVPKAQCPELTPWNSILFLLPQASRTCVSFFKVFGSLSALTRSSSQQMSLAQCQKMALNFACCLSQPSRAVIAFSPFLNLTAACVALLWLLPSIYLWHATEKKIYNAAVASGLWPHLPPLPWQNQAWTLLSAEITPLHFPVQCSAEPAALACFSPENAIIDLFRWSG